MGLFFTHSHLKIMNFQKKFDDFLNLYEYAVNFWSWKSGVPQTVFSYMYTYCTFWTAHIYIFQGLIWGTLLGMGASTLVLWNGKKDWRVLSSFTTSYVVQRWHGKDANVLFLETIIWKSMKWALGRTFSYYSCHVDWPDRYGASPAVVW
jgi:hypothetical protein